MYYDSTFRESVFKWWVAVQGLNHTELRLVSFNDQTLVVKRVKDCGQRQGPK